MVKYHNKTKFEGNKPLLEYPSPGYPRKMHIQYHQFEEPKEFDIFDSIKGQIIELGNKKIIFGVKAREEELVKYDFLWCTDGPAFVVHNRVKEKFQDLCSEDFQALPVIIKNLNPEDTKFENYDFWLINIFPVKDMLDYNKAQIKTYEDGFKMVRKKAFRSDLWGRNKLIRDELSLAILFHPSLAKHFIKSKGVEFVTDEELHTQISKTPF